MVTTPTIDELRARVTEAGPWFEVPADAKPTQCRGCGCMVYFITTAAGKTMPVDALVPRGRVPYVGDDVFPARVGRAVSHFATCTAAGEFRRPR